MLHAGYSYNANLFIRAASPTHDDGNDSDEFNDPSRRPTTTAICHHPDSQCSTVFVAVSSITPRTRHVVEGEEDTTTAPSHKTWAGEPRATAAHARKKGYPMTIFEYDTRTKALVTTLIVPKEITPWKEMDRADYLVQLVPVSTAGNKRSYLVAIGAMGCAWVWRLPHRAHLNEQPRYLGRRQLSPSSLSITACGSMNTCRPTLYYAAGRTGDVDAWSLDDDVTSGGSSESGESGESGEGVGSREGVEGVEGGEDGEDDGEDDGGRRRRTLHVHLSEGVYNDSSVTSVYRSTETLHKRTASHHAAPPSRESHHSVAHHDLTTMGDGADSGGGQHGGGGGGVGTSLEQHQEPLESLLVVTAMGCHATLPLLSITHADGKVRVVDVAGVVEPPTTCCSLDLSEATRLIASEPEREDIELNGTSDIGRGMEEEKEQTRSETDLLIQLSHVMDPIVETRDRHRWWNLETTTPHVESHSGGKRSRAAAASGNAHSSSAGGVSSSSFAAPSASHPPRTLSIRFHPKEPHLLLVLCVVNRHEYYIIVYDLSTSSTSSTSSSSSCCFGRRRCFR